MPVQASQCVMLCNVAIATAPCRACVDVGMAGTRHPGAEPSGTRAVGPCSFPFSKASGRGNGVQAVGLPGRRAPVALLTECRMGRHLHFHTAIAEGCRACSSLRCCDVLVSDVARSARDERAESCSLWKGRKPAVSTLKYHTSILKVCSQEYLSGSHVLK